GHGEVEKDQACVEARAQRREGLAAVPHTARVEPATLQQRDEGLAHGPIVVDHEDAMPLIPTACRIGHTQCLAERADRPITTLERRSSRLGRPRPGLVLPPQGRYE